MGLNLLGSRDRYEAGMPAPTDPDPKKFIIKELTQIGHYVIAKVNYPNCTTFDGNKILVFEHATTNGVRVMSIIDPHFTERRSSPIARFSATERGELLAKRFCETATKIIDLEETFGMQPKNTCQVGCPVLKNIYELFKHEEQSLWKQVDEATEEANWVKALRNRAAAYSNICTSLKLALDPDAAGWLLRSMGEGEEEE
jgi:hypothetical protein